MIYNFVISLKRPQKRFILLSVDSICVVISLLLALWLSSRALPLDMALQTGAKFLMVQLVVGYALAQLFGLHRIKLIAFELQGVIETGYVAAALGVSGAAVNFMLGVPLPWEVFVIQSMAFLSLSVSARLLMLRIVQIAYRSARDRKRVLIYGAGQTGQQLAAALATDDEVEPVAFVDDNHALQSLTIGSLHVYAPAQIKELINTIGIDRVVIAMPSASRLVRSRIARRLFQMGIDVHVLPSFAELVVEGDLAGRARPVEMTDLLGRTGVDADLPGITEAYRDHRILVTGAGGSIGSELCRQLVSCQPDCLVLMDHSEVALYNIERELNDIAPEITVVPILGSVCEYGLVHQTLVTYGIQVVLHAAAYKHVTMVEKNSIEGLRNNVLGTKTVADAARATKVERFILVSSDKAVRPTSVMGSSKRLAEMVVQDLATRVKSGRFSMVRFGNVLGSSGSVIPLFEDQIARGGPVTVTHDQATRYFMTVHEAVRLVLLAGSFARGGDVFVLDMGKPVPITQLARQMIEGAGYSVRSADNPEGDIAIKITGLRPGEKLHEELLIGTDMLTTPHPKIMRAQEGHLSEIETANVIQELRRVIESRDVLAAEAMLNRWIEQGGEDFVPTEPVKEKA